MAEKLYDSDSLSWPGYFAAFVRELHDKGVDEAEISDLAMQAFNAVLKAVNEALPEGCWWAPGAGTGIFGPAGTELPDIEDLISQTFEAELKKIRGSE